MKIKRLVRFLTGAGGIKFLYAWRNEDEACDITVLVDSDFAGNTETSAEGWQTCHPHLVVDANQCCNIKWKVEKPSSSRCMMVRHGDWGCRR